MAKRLPIFTVDWESWKDALHLEDKDDRLREPTLYLLILLKKYDIKAIFYILGETRERNMDLYEFIIEDGHTIKSHGMYHYRGQLHADRQPYQFLGFCGGFWMRFLPYWLWKLFVKLQGHCYVHPHDVMLFHPKVPNRLLNFKRQFGLKQSRLRLERLLSEVKFDSP